ncbi:MAG: MerR family transcriptional regulator [Pseudomonadota bacterium]
MEKSPDAFRTISEVADWLDVPTHVLRFWESRFSQVKPVKRAGGRRYYRPNDMLLIGGIKVLLHDEGMTIRGVQKLLREEGIKHVAGYSKPLGAEDVIEGTAVEETPAVDKKAKEPAKPVEAAAPRAAGEAAAEGTEGSEVSPEPEDDAAAPMPAFGSVRGRNAASPKPAGPETVTEPEPAAPIVVPGLPETDPADDDPAFSAGPALSVRISALAPERLSARRAELAQLHGRLAALRARTARTG